MKYITKNFVLEHKDLKILRETADVRGLGSKGLSAALRQIIREWADQKSKDNGNKENRANS